MKINIMETYKESFHNIRTHKRGWLKAATGPLIVWAMGLLVLISAMIATRYDFGFFSILANVSMYANLSHHVKDSIHIQEFPPDTYFFYLAFFIYNILFFVAVINLEINGYRYAVLEEINDRLINVKLDRRFFKLIIYTILFEILGGVYISIAAGIIISINTLLANGAINAILGFFLFLWGFYIMYRVTLFPVLISIDQSQPFKTSWRLMKGNVLRIIGLSILVTLTILLVGTLSALVMILIWYSLAVLIAILSTLFMFLIWLSLNALAGMANAPLDITESVILGCQIGFGVVLALFWIVFLVLFAWALNSKVMGLVYQQLSAHTILHSINE